MGLQVPPLLKRAQTLLRSLLVGAGATLLDLAILAVLVTGVGIAPKVASLPALSVGILWQFIGNKWFAFGDRSNRWAKQGALFLVVEALGFVANLLLFNFAITHLAWPYLLVRVMVTSLVYFALCYPLWTLIFRARHHAVPPACNGARANRRPSYGHVPR